MKKPSEILFDRHASATPKLDAIRDNVIAELPAQQNSWISEFVARFFLPLRWHFAGMAAVWAMAALLAVDRADVPRATVVANGSASPRPLLITLLENRKQLIEMTDPSPGQPASAPAVFVPRRRGDLLPTQVVV